MLSPRWPSRPNRSSGRGTHSFLADSGGAKQWWASSSPCSVTCVARWCGCGIAAQVTAVTCYKSFSLVPPYPWRRLPGLRPRARSGGVRVGPGRRYLSQWYPRNEQHLTHHLYTSRRNLKASQPFLWSCLYAFDLPWTHYIYVTFFSETQ